MQTYLSDSPQAPLGYMHEILLNMFFTPVFYSAGFQGKQNLLQRFWRHYFWSCRTKDTTLKPRWADPRWARSGQVADWIEQTRERQRWYPNRPGYCYWTWGPVTRDKSHWLVCSDGDFGTDPRYADGDAREYEGFLQRRAGVEWTSRRKLILDNLCCIARSMFKDSLSWEYCGTNQDKLKKNQETDKQISDDKSCTTVDFSWVIFWNTCKCTSIC